MTQPRTPRSPDTLERTRYFARQAVLPDDLSQDREYLLHKFRRHNRVLHGWGIWSGLAVEKFPDVVKRPTGDEPKETDSEMIPPEWAAYKKFVAAQSAFQLHVGGVPETVGLETATWLAVAPGFALTPLGDEVYLPTWVFVDTSREIDGGLVTTPATCRSLAARKLVRGDTTYFLVVEAVEAEARPVRAASQRCGDNPDQFEFSRLTDTLRFRLVEKREPDSTQDPYTAKKPPKGETPEEVTPRRAARIVTGCVQREELRLAAVMFAGGKMGEPDMVTTEKQRNRDWFTKTEPDTATAPRIPIAMDL